MWMYQFVLTIQNEFDWSVLMFLELRWPYINRNRFQVKFSSKYTIIKRSTLFRFSINECYRSLVVYTSKLRWIPLDNSITVHVLAILRLLWRGFHWFELQFVFFVVTRWLFVKSISPIILSKFCDHFENFKHKSQVIRGVGMERVGRSMHQQRQWLRISPDELFHVCLENDDFHSLRG